MSNNLQLQVLLNAVDKATRPFKAVENASKILSGEIRGSQQQLKTLNAQAAQVEGFRKIKGQLSATGEALAQAKTKAATLAAELRNSENPTKAQARALENAKQQAAALKNEYGTLRLSVQRQRGEMLQAGISTRNLSSAERQLRGDISATTANLNRQREALARVSQQQEKLTRVSQRYEKGKQVTAGVRNASAAAFGVGSAALYAESKLIAPGVEFDKQMSGTQSILGLDKADAKLQAIRQQAREIGATTAFSPNDVARTQTTLARSGYNADAVLAATGSTVNLSLASGMDIAESADIVTNMQSAFNIPIDQIQRVADVMTTGFTTSNTSLYDLGEAMKYVAPIAEAAGASIEDTTAMLGVLADNGIKGSMAGTSTSAVFNRLQAPVGQAVDALKELGVKTRDKKGDALPIFGVLKAIDASFKKNKLGSAQQAEYLKVIFGEEAMKSAIKLVDAAGDGKLASKRQTIGQSQGSTARVAKIQTDNLDGDLKNLASAWEDIQIEVFEKQDGALRRLTQSATDWLTKVGDWVKANPELVRKIVAATGAITALVAVLGGIGLVIWPVMTGINALIAGAGLLSTGFSVAGGVMATAIGALSWPVVAVVAAIVAGAMLIRKYWEPISAFFGGVMEGLKVAFAPIAELFAPLKPVFDWLEERLTAAWNWFMQLVAPVKSTQETLNSCRDAGVAFGQMLANALTMPVQALNTLRSGIDWVLEKLGIVNKESSTLNQTAAKTNAATQPGAYIPPTSSYVGYQAYQPVTATAPRSYVDQSKSEYNITLTGDVSSSGDLNRQLREELERHEREKRARARASMDYDG